MRAIVTGAGGFVGKHLVSHLLKSGDIVLATDLNGGSFRDFKCPFFKDAFQSEFLATDILDVTNIVSCQNIIQDFKPDVIYHLAGIAFVPEAEEDFEKALIINVGAVNNIVRSCHLLENKAKVLFTSSAEVYGRMALEELPLTESTQIIPANNYSLSKSMGELVCTRYAQFENVFPIVMRPFNHIGPAQNDRFVVSSFAKQLAMIKKGLAKPELSVGNLSPKRDFSDVRDIVRAYRMAISLHSGTLNSRVYNLCSGKAVSVQAILDKLIELSGLKVSVEIDQNRYRESEVNEIYGSYAKAENDFNWKPEISLERSLEDTYKYFLDLV